MNTPPLNVNMNQPMNMNMNVQQMSMNAQQMNINAQQLSLSTHQMNINAQQQHMNMAAHPMNMGGQPMALMSAQPMAIMNPQPINLNAMGMSAQPMMHPQPMNLNMNAQPMAIGMNPQQMMNMHMQHLNMSAQHMNMNPQPINMNAQHIHMNAQQMSMNAQQMNMNMNAHQMNMNIQPMNMNTHHFNMNVQPMSMSAQQINIQQLNAQHMIAQQISSQQMGVQQLSTHQIGIHQIGGQQMGGHQMPGHQMGGHQMGSHQMVGQQMGSQQMGSQQMGSQQMGSQQMGSQPMGSQQNPLFLPEPPTPPVDREKICEWLLELNDPATRENALIELGKRREDISDLALLIWHGFGTAAALLQEVMNIYPAINPAVLSASQSNRVCNALALLQCVAAHPETRPLFIAAQFPLFLYPFLHTVSKNRPFEYLRLTCLGVIGALVKNDESPVIQFLLDTEIIPLCLRIMECGSELSKTVATFILQKILANENGLNYICETYERFSHIAMILGKLVLTLARCPSARLLKHIVRCYLRLTDHPRAREALRQCLPDQLVDQTFNYCLQDEPVTRSWIAQIIKNLEPSEPKPDQQQAHMSSTSTAPH